MAVYCRRGLGCGPALFASSGADGMPYRGVTGHRRHLPPYEPMAVTHSAPSPTNMPTCSLRPMHAMALAYSVTRCLV